MPQRFPDKSGQKEVIYALLCKKPGSYSRDFMAVTGMSSNRISMYLHRLLAEGLVTVDKSGGRGFACWTVVDLDKVDCMPVKCVVKKAWEPHLVRDPLVEAIFGRAA